MRSRGSHCSGETETFSYELGKTNKRPFCSKSSLGLSNSIFVKTCAILCTSDGTNEPEGSFASISRDSGNAEKRSNPKHLQS